MIDISKLDDNKKSILINNLWESSSDLWSIVESSFKKNYKYWTNNPEWLAEVPRKRSKARDNRTFLATESVISNLLGKPSKPSVIPANETDEAKQISEDLQDFFLEKYKTLGIKGKMRTGLRNLFLSRLIILKIFWNNETDDFDLKPVNPINIRFSKKATSMYDTEFAIEKIDKPIQEIIESFPEQEAAILKKTGFTKEQVILNNPTAEWWEAWLGGEVIYKLQGTILHTEKHPYWDWEGVKMTQNEKVKFGNLPLNEQRGEMRKIKKWQEIRDKLSVAGRKYENYLYNHFDKSIPPYIFGAVLAVEDKPIGDTSLIEQVIPLQEEIDKRKRQISDNCEMMNGQYKIDTRFVKISKADAQMAKSDPRGMWYGDGVRDGVTIETGKELPSFIKDDLNHSTIELDNIFGTQPTFRGERGAQETATGRAILREQSFQRLEDLVDLVDNIHLQLYNWIFQIMKVKYTESHYVKYLGAEKARRVIELTRDDLSEGIEIQIIPGQIMPDDKIFKAE